MADRSLDRMALWLVFGLLYSSWIVEFVSSAIGSKPADEWDLGLLVVKSGARPFVFVLVASLVVHGLAYCAAECAKYYDAVAAGSTPNWRRSLRFVVAAVAAVSLICVLPVFGWMALGTWDPLGIFGIALGAFLLYQTVRFVYRTHP